MNERDFPGKPKVTFGIRVPNSGPLASPESIVQVGREAASLGSDSLWVHDHLNANRCDMRFAEVALASDCVGFWHFRNWRQLMSPDAVETFVETFPMMLAEKSSIAVV